MRFTLSVAVACCVVACSPPPPPTETDAGSVEADAGELTPADSGVEVDAGITIDAGVPVDAGTSGDAGTEDAGAPIDAGTQVDAGAQTDAGAPIDAGVDAGCRCTASQYCSAGSCLADIVPPRVTVTASAGTTAATLHVTGTASDGETGLASVELRLDGMSAVAVNVVAGSYDAQVPVPAGRAEYTVVATARDLANNPATAQTTFDGAAPAIALTPSQDGACSASGCTGAFIDAAATSFVLSAAVTEGLSLASIHPVQVRVLNGSTEVVAWTDLVLQPNGSWSWTWSSLPALDFSQLTLEVAATDAANNRGTASLGVLLDRVRPTLTFTPSTNASCTATACTGAVVNAASTSLNLAGLVSPDATLSLRVLDGAAVVFAPVPVPQTAGVWSYAWTGIPNVDGRFYSLEVTATDALLNSFTQRLVVLVDRVVPGVVVSSPRAGDLVGSAQVTVNATATDGLGLKAVELATSVNGPFVFAARDANGDYVGQLPVPPVDAVEQVLTVRATDLADNVRVVSTRYTADRVAPVVTLGGADFDCSGTGACTGSVANGASTQVAYGGTVSDGSAVTLQKNVVGPSGIVAASTDPVSAPNWSWTWSTLPPGVNGAAYELRVIATDAAGNSSAQVTRRTWLDNVAPTVTIPVAGQRNVDPLATLAVFTEPMNQASVIAAATFNPAVVLATIGSADSVSFNFSSAVLKGYTPYALTLGAASDKAGNTSASVSGSFLTAPLVGTGPLYNTMNWQCRSPRIVVDADGRYTVAFSYVSGSSASTWVTRAVGDGNVWAFGPAGSTATVQVPTDLRITASPRAADGRLTTQFELGSVFTNGSGTWLANESFSIGWNGAIEAVTGPAQQTIGATNAMTLSNLNANRPVIDLVPYRDLFTGARGAYRSVVAPNNGATAMSTWNEQPSWAATSTGTLASFRSMDGRASVESPSTFGPYRVRYWDLGMMSEVASANFVRSATAQPAFKTTDRFGAAALASSSYVAWTTDTVLSVGCSAAPFAAPPVWQTSSVTMPAGRTTGSPLASAMTPSTFAVVAEYGGNVYVYSTPLTGCAAPPALTQVGRIDGVSEPAVTIDSTGKIWVAWIAANGQVGVSRF